MAATDLVTIDGAMTAAHVTKYFEDPSSFTFTFTEDPEEIAKRIEARALGADSAAALFGGDEVLSVKKNPGILNKPYKFLSVEFLPSSLDGEGLPFFALFRVADVDGALHLISCGARTVMLKAAKASQENWFPLWLKLVEVDVKNAVKGHSKPLDLVFAPDPSPVKLDDGTTF